MSSIDFPTVTLVPGKLDAYISYRIAVSVQVFVFSFLFFFFLTPASNLKNFRAKNFHLNFDFSLFLLFPLKLKTPLNNG